MNWLTGFWTDKAPVQAFAQGVYQPETGEMYLHPTGVSYIALRSPGGVFAHEAFDTSALSGGFWTLSDTLIAGFTSARWQSQHMNTGAILPPQIDISEISLTYNYLGSGSEIGFEGALSAGTVDAIALNRSDLRAMRIGSGLVYAPASAARVHVALRDCAGRLIARIDKPVCGRIALENNAPGVRAACVTFIDASGCPVAKRMLKLYTFER